MKLTHALPAIAFTALAGVALAKHHKEGEGSEAPAPLKILLVAGGCCHDYETQKEILKGGIEERLNAVVSIAYNPSKETTARFEVYDDPAWAEAYDLVIHDECSASVEDKEYVGRILNGHREGTPAVNLHCAMHSYRWGDFKAPVEIGADNAGWFEMIGLQSSGHGPKEPIQIEFSEEAHPIIAGLEDWETLPEELYNNISVYEGTVALATGTQSTKPKNKPNAEPKVSTAVVAWASEYGENKTRIFSTSLGHFNETVMDDRYLELVTRGILWATGHLNEDGTAVEGYAAHAHAHAPAAAAGE